MHAQRAYFTATAHAQRAFVHRYCACAALHGNIAGWNGELRIRQDRSQSPLTESQRRREDRLRKRERGRKSRASESAEENEVRIRRCGERERARRASETMEQRQARLEHAASYWHTRPAMMLGFDNQPCLTRVGVVTKV